jgi:hypothetical protein
MAQVMLPFPIQPVVVSGLSRFLLLRVNKRSVFVQEVSRADKLLKLLLKLRFGYSWV